MSEAVQEPEPFYLKYGHLNFESLFAVSASFSLWRGTYHLLRYMLPDRSSEFSARIICAIHGFLAGFLGINECFVIDTPFEHPEWRTTYIQTFIMVMSLGYFMHDLMWTLYNQPEDKVMICHHVYCVFTLWRLLFKGYSGSQATCMLGCMEITNPFLQARWFIRSLGMYPSVVYISVETTYFLIFVGVRIVLGTYLLWEIFKQPKNEWEFVILAFMLYLLSWAFVVQMVHYMRKKYLNKGRS